MTDNKGLRLAIDIGGTFTDTVLVQGDASILASTKTLTTKQNPAEGALLGARRVMAQSGRRFSEVQGFIHGTTLATNALIERRGAVVATVCTDGFRDILEIAYERRYNQYDIHLQKPDLIVSRDRSFTIPERIAADGHILLPIDERALERLLAEIDAAHAEAIAICLMHAYANPVHERRLRDLLTAARPRLTVCISSDVSPEAREFDRLCTTVANAYIQPLMQSYLSSFVKRFADEGLACPILMMTAGGGMTTIETAARFPIRLVESGPAGGAILAARIAAQCGLDEVLSFDMGGTTAKLCLIDRARPQTSRQFEVARAARFIKGSGMPVRIPAIDLIEIGAGGGSIAAVDRLGRLVVGPKSAGSEPGPAAFGQGGVEPTVTDADVTLGYIVPDTFAEGQFAIQPEAARRALVERVAEPLEVDAVGAADGVSRIVDESMASACRIHAVESGKSLEPRTMIAFGGNGPLHACRVARSAGITRILIPPNPSVGSAVGFVYAPVSFEIVRSRYTMLQLMDVVHTNTLFETMISEATQVVRQGACDVPVTMQRSAFMRYSGQGHEIEVKLPDRPLENDDIVTLTQAFEREYARQFSRPVPGMKIEILNWAVRVATIEPPATPIAAPQRTHSIRATTTQAIICDVDSATKHAALIARDVLQPGDQLNGPALITESQTTTFVGADFCARIDGAGNIILTRHKER